MKARTSIRKYSEKEVSEELLDSLLEAAARTQTMGNLQLYSVVVTRSAEMKERLAPAHFNQPMVKGAPVVLTICADFTRTSTWCRHRKAQPRHDNMPGQIIDTLQLPKLVMPVATLTVGWPDEQPALTDRLPLASFVHHEQYADYSPQDIDTYYCAKEQLPENLKFVEINKKETLAQIFTDIRYTKRDNEALSQTFMDTLRKQGFLD